jgi:hypothetical protein
MKFDYLVLTRGDTFWWCRLTTICPVTIASGGSAITETLANGEDIFFVTEDELRQLRTMEADDD